MPVRLIAIDIDGTLLDSHGALPDENRAALAEVVARGIEVVLVTGRSYHHARHVAAGLPTRVTLIVNNGALTKSASGTTLESRPLGKQIAVDLAVATRPYREGIAAVFDRAGRDQFVCEGIDWEHPRRRPYYELNRQFIVETDRLETALTEDPVQVMFNGTVDAMRDLAARLKAMAGSDINVTLTEYARVDFSLLDVLAAGCSKGVALARWARSREVDAADTMAIGDNLNDRDMLAFAGVPVVMGNAVDRLKSFGWPQTASNDEAGVAQAIARFALPAESS